MATPRCPKCENSSFELQEIKIRSAVYRHYAINCTSCGCVVAIQEFFNLGAKIYKLAEKLRIDLDR